MLGGRAVNPQTTDLAERRLLNVVEEMALASGIPVPPVYVLDHEPGINAFAAGHQPRRRRGGRLGRLPPKYLTREELQGVMGHEFSHILNGDMRLNLRLIGIVYGILVLAIIGYYVMRIAPVSSLRATRRGGGAALAIFLVGLALMIFGYLGRVLRQPDQERHLAAARVPGRRLVRPVHAQSGRNRRRIEEDRRPEPRARGFATPTPSEISHMFFGDAFAGSFFNLFATHPPLDRAHPGVGAGV